MDENEVKKTRTPIDKNHRDGYYSIVLSLQRGQTGLLPQHNLSELTSSQVRDFVTRDTSNVVVHFCESRSLAGPPVKRGREHL